MSVCDVCGGVTADHGRHLKWHRTMSNIPPRDGAPLTDIRVAYPWHDFGSPEPTPIYDALLRETTVRDFMALGEEYRAFPSITLGADTSRYREGMRRLAEAMQKVGPKP
jgi:hypothetical protein